MSDSESETKGKFKEKEKTETYRVSPASQPVNPAAGQKEAAPSQADPLQAMRAMAMPGYNMSAFVENYQKNLTALTDSSDIMMRSAQSIVTRQAEIFGDAMQETLRLLNSVFTVPCEERPEMAQLKATQELFIKALENLQEIAEISSRARTESIKPISRRIDEVLKRDR